MNITGQNLSTIEAKRFIRHDEKKQKVRIDHNIEMLSLTREERDVTAIEFRYTISYGPVGVIVMSGLVFYSDGRGRVHKEWQATGQVPAPAKDEVINHIFNVFGLHEGFPISRKVNLPPPFPVNIPRVSSNISQDGQHG